MDEIIRHSFLIRRHNDILKTCVKKNIYIYTAYKLHIDKLFLITHTCLSHTQCAFFNITKTFSSSHTHTEFEDTPALGDLLRLLLLKEIPLSWTEN